MQFFPAILYPADGKSTAGCLIPGENINASGSSDADALTDAVEILQELIAEAEADGRPTPTPASVAAVRAEIAAHGGQLVWLPAMASAGAA